MKKIQRIFFICLLATMSISWGAILEIHAAEVKPATNTANKTAAEPEAKSGAKISVYVELAGTDTIGSKLSFQLKERFNTSSQFLLTDKDTPKLMILVSTAPEFESRPSVGSAYAVTWLYSQSNTLLSNYLVQEVGTVSEADVDDLVTRLVERSRGIAAKNAYLLNSATAQ